MTIRNNIANVLPYLWQWAQVVLGIALAWFGTWGFRTWWIAYEDAKYIAHISAAACAIAMALYFWHRFKIITDAPKEQRNDQTPIKANRLTISALLLIPFAYFFGYTAIGNSVSALTTQILGDQHTQLGNVHYSATDFGRGSSWCHYDLWIDTESARHHFCVEEKIFLELPIGSPVALEGRKSRFGFKITRMPSPAEFIR